MKVPRYQIANIIAKLSLKSDADAKELSSEIAAYLLSERRTGELHSLLRDVASLRAKQGIVEVNAVSAHKLTDTVLSDIREQVQEQYPSAKQIIINERIDKNLVGGVRLEMLDKQLDLSVRAKLNRFKQLTTSERTV